MYSSEIKAFNLKDVCVLESERISALPGRLWRPWLANL